MLVKDFFFNTIRKYLVEIFIDTSKASFMDIVDTKNVEVTSLVYDWSPQLLARGLVKTTNNIVRVLVNVSMLLKSFWRSLIHTPYWYIPIIKIQNELYLYWILSSLLKTHISLFPLLLNIYTFSMVQCFCGGPTKSRIQRQLPSISAVEWPRTLTS